MFTAIVLSSCGAKSIGFSFKIKNNSNYERTNETVAIPIDVLKSKNVDFSQTLVIEELSSGMFYATQLSKADGSDSVNQLLFQPEIKPNAIEAFSVRPLKKGEVAPSTSINCYSRFVPERIDDYAWENDKVAFRVYGPEAQRLVEVGKYGTLSSGIDCWLKKVDYLIIDKWYKKAKNGGSYHKDEGEGLDSYHVGGSRGCGGTGMLDENTNIFYASKNYTSWEKIEDGNIRGSFKLWYEPWIAGKDTIHEVKYFTFDKGSNFTRVEITLTGAESLWAGITLHNKTGEITYDKNEGWFNHWEVIEGTELNTAIVVNPKYIIDYKEYTVDKPDESNLLVHLKAIDGKVVYYTGFYWKESGQFQDSDDWFNHLTKMSNQISNPLRIIFE